MTTIWLALGAVVVVAALIALVWLTARHLGRREFEAKAAEIGRERARRRNEINADVDRLSDSELDDRLRSNGRRRL